MADAARMVYRVAAALPVLTDPGQRVSTSSEIFDRNGHLVTVVPGAGDRQPVGLAQIPPELQDAFIATEDRTFYTNIGVSFRGIARAALVDVTHRFRRSTLQGASTISQQLADILYLNRRDTLTRKLQQAMVAVELNRRYTKPQILDMYLNDVYLGEHATGVQAAAITYFDQPDLGKLTLGQMALLAGLPQAPSTYDPYVDPKAARVRRDEVLQYMVEAGYISAAQAASAAAQPVAVRRGALGAAQASYPYPWFVEAVIQQLEQPPFGLPEAEIVGGGLQIYTTLDPTIQSAADAAVAAHQAELPPGIETGVAVVDQHTGDVVAIEGGFEHQAQFELDRAVGISRQPGSTIKPLVDYIPALESGLTAGTVVDDVIRSYPDPYAPGGQYVPTDDSPPYYGLTTLTEALRRSVNTVAVAVLSRIGVKKGFDNAVAMGLPLAPQDATLAVAIGGISGTTCCSPLDMAAAYAAIANGGMRVKPRMITRVMGPDGQVIINNPVQFKRVVDPRIAFVMTKMLEAVNNPLPTIGSSDAGWDSDWGTGYDQQVKDDVAGSPSAGKTGTTEHDQDAWFVGFTPLYTAAVWLGYDQPKPVSQLFGGTDAGPIWQEIMDAAVAGKAVQDFPQPPGVVQVPIDAKCAQWSVCSPGPLTPSSWIRPEWFVAGTQPTPATSHNVWVRVPVVAGGQGAAGLPTLWQPACGGTPANEVVVQRPFLGMDWAQPVAAYFNWKLGADQYLPVDETDPSVAMPWATCTGAPVSGGAVAGTPGGAAGSGSAAGAGPSDCAESWLVSVGQGPSVTPAAICVYLGRPASIAFRAADGRTHIVALEGYGAQATVPASGAAAALTVTPFSAGGAVLVVDGTPAARLTVAAASPTTP